MRRVSMGTLVVIALAGAVVVAGGFAQTGNRASGTRDLTGHWRLDPAQSDGLREGGGFQRGPGVGRGDGRGRRNGMGGRRGGPRTVAPEGAPRNGFRRPLALPALMHVTESPIMVTFEDSTGAVVREIVTSSAPADSAAAAADARRLEGIWNGDRLEVHRNGPRGAMTESYVLEENGDALVIRTKRESPDSTRSREIKRVYRRVTEW